MSTKIKTLTLLGSALLALSFTLPALADEPADAADGDVMTLYLGKLPITGKEKIVATLVAIKKALHEPLSNDPEKAETVVCSVVTDTDSRKEYLDCATNAAYAGRRQATTVGMISRKLGIPQGGGEDGMTQADFDSLVANQPNNRLHVPVNGAALQSLLASIPDDATVVESSGG
ncbi:MAG TPA: hypothetical protein VF651_01325 [Gammaproteobacteria bacterium]